MIIEQDHSPPFILSNREQILHLIFGEWQPLLALLGKHFDGLSRIAWTWRTAQCQNGRGFSCGRSRFPRVVDGFLVPAMVELLIACIIAGSSAFQEREIDGAWLPRRVRRGDRTNNQRARN